MNGRLSILNPVILSVCLLINTAQAVQPKNVILLIGDGMGFEQVKAAGMYLNGAAGTLSFESLPYQGQLTTYAANASVTDSAAAGTALATGFKVNNGVISMAFPGNGHELRTSLEYYQLLGYRTGLVTTTYITHATPATFGAHEPSRDNTGQIATDYLNQTRPEVLFGGGGNGISPASATNAGYTVATTCAQLQAIDANTATRVSAQFGTYHLPYEYDGTWSGECHLSQMTVWALDMLEEDPDGFFLMVEGGRIDHAGHDHNLQRNVFETIEFAATAQAVITWAAGRTDTLIIVTADHETGGLQVVTNNGQNQFPTVNWTASGHTGVNVPIYAWGVNANLVSGTLDNTQVFDIVTVSPEITRSPASFSHQVDLGQPLGNDTFTLQNTAMETLNYTITDNADWIEVSPSSGACTSETDTISVIYHTETLGGGVHSAEITISDPLARNNPQKITVTVTVIGPTIVLSPSTLERSVVQTGSLTPDQFTVANGGGLTLNYTITDDADWLETSETAGSSTGEADPIDVIYNVGDLDIGTHTAEISVSSIEAGNSPQKITVTVTVTPIPGDFDLDRDVDQKDFGLIQGCLTANGQPLLSPACEIATLDSDGDVDQSDLGIFIGCLSGADAPANPGCVP